MRLQRFFIALTVVNLGLTIFLMAQLRRVEAIAPVARAKLAFTV